MRLFLLSGVKVSFLCRKMIDSEGVMETDILGDLVKLMLLAVLACAIGLSGLRNVDHFDGDMGGGG